MEIWVDYKRVERKVALETAKDRLPRAFSDAKRERLEYVIKQLEDESVTNIPPQTATLKGEYPLNILNELFKDFDDDYTLTPDAAATIDYVLSEDAFSNKDREIIGLRYREGETLDTISQELGITKEAVRTRINKALRKLKYIRRIRLIKMGIGCYIEQMKGALAARDKEIAKRDAEISELKATIAAMSSMPLPLTDEVKGIKIWELDLSTRSFNALARAGLETVEDICNYSEPFCKIRNLGIKSFEELKSVLETKGIPFAGVWKNEGEG